MTEEQIILQLKNLKGIQPAQPWVALTKSQILGAQLAWFGFMPKVAYAFLALAIAMVGTLGLVQFTAPGDGGIAISGSLMAANTFAQEIKKDPNKAKAAVLELKKTGTLAALSGTAETKESSDVVYKAIDEQMIKDLEKSTLSETQQKTLAEVKALFDQQEYAKALEKILSM